MLRINDKVLIYSNSIVSIHNTLYKIMNTKYFEDEDVLTTCRLCDLNKDDLCSDLINKGHYLCPDLDHYLGINVMNIYFVKINLNENSLFSTSYIRNIISNINI